MEVSTPLTSAQVRSRIVSIDALRGIVMVVMALDHTRDFLHKNGFFTDPANVATTTPVLFFTRWITHYCAPTFVFLAGISAFLIGRRMLKPELSIYLLTRGLWLMLLEVTVVDLILWFDVTFSIISLQVIWATGVGMVVLSGLIHLPSWLIRTIGLVLVVGHNTLDGITFERGTTGELIWSMLYQPNRINLSSGASILTLYPVLAWVGIITLGYCFGEMYSDRIGPEKRRRLLRKVGIGAVLGFVMLRAINLYGDPAPWSVQKTPLFTFLSFLNTSKYPPSLLFTLMTLGPALLLLGWLEGRQNRWTRFFTVYGRVPLFYYVLHFTLIHCLAVLFLMLDGVPWASINFQNGSGGVMPDRGVSLGMVYLVWLGVVLSLYPLCRWYGQFRSRQKSRMWSYL